MKPISIIASLALTLILSGCATGTMALKEDNFDQKLATTPHIKKLSTTAHPVRRQESEIEVFYKSWNALTAPNAIVNWESHFQVGKESSTSRQYEKLAEITHFQKERDDAKAMAFLRKLAADEGGDAIIDVWKSPAIDKISLPAKIFGYRYQGVAVKYR